MTTDTPAHDLRSALEYLRMLDRPNAIGSDGPNATRPVPITYIRAIIAALAQPAENAKGGEGYSVSGKIYEDAVKGRQDFRAAYREQRDLLSAKEWAAVEQVGKEQELSISAVLRQAVRQYQSDHERRKAGETVKWSGDEQRAIDFAGPLCAHPPAAEPVGLREAAAIPQSQAIADKVIADAQRFINNQGGFAAYADQVAAGTTGWSRLRSTIWLSVTSALTTPARTDDAGRANGDVAAMREATGGFSVGDRVIKHEGYPFGIGDAVVVAAYRCAEGSGPWRYVVEHPEGWQHIFSGKQLSLSTPPAALDEGQK